MRVKAPFVGGHLKEPDIRSYVLARVGYGFHAIAVQYFDRYYRPVAQFFTPLGRRERGFRLPHPGLSEAWAKSEEII